MAGFLTQASRQMIIQINNSGQKASEKEDSPFKGQETWRKQEVKSWTDIKNSISILVVGDMIDFCFYLFSFH